MHDGDEGVHKQSVCKCDVGVQALQSALLAKASSCRRIPLGKSSSGTVLDLNRVWNMVCYNFENNDPMGLIVVVNSRVI